jgi:tetratricopeptide (TPR) repeat protein
MPAAAAAAAAITVLAINPRGDQDKFRGRYRLDAQRAFAAHEWDEADVRYRRLAADMGYPADDVFGLARVLEAEGRREEADALFDRLAPEDLTGHPIAHFRRAVKLLAEGQPSWRIERHLLRAVHGNPDLAEAHALLGQMKLNAGERDAAAHYLALAVHAHPELSLPLAEAFTGKDVDVAARWAAAAVDHFGPPAKARPEDAEAQFSYARALYLAGRYRESAETIRAVLARADDARLRRLAAEVYADWCNKLTGEASAGERVRRIEEGLAINPGAGPLVQALISTAAGSGSASIAARLSVDHRIASGGPDATALRLALGIESVRRGNLAEARRLIGDAHRDDPASPVIANNFAWLLIQDPDPDPTRALKIVEIALETRPDEPNLRDTRGQVYIRLSRWKDAVRDLEFALPRIAPNKTTHRALAAAYRGLHMAALAEAQDRKANELPQ